MAVKIVHFITELSVGGAQMALFHLLEDLDREQYDLQVICLYNGDGFIAKKIQSLGIPVYDLGMTSKWRLDAFVRLYRYLREQRPFILHTWMFHANIPGRIIGRLARVPHTISSERTMGQESTIRLRINRWTSSYADCVICVSKSIGEYAIEKIGIPASKITIIPNGIDNTKFSTLPSQKAARQKLGLPFDIPLVVAVGRPRPVKGYIFLIKAWREVTKRFPQAQLIFLGDGPDRIQLEKQAARYNLSNSISFLGEKENIPHLLPAFNLFALPSLHEGMSNATLEAMAAGLPVIATAVGGTPEIVVHKQTGLLVPPSDSDALANALSALLTTPKHAQQMGKAGQERVFEHFLHTQTVQLTESVYKMLL